LTVKVAVKPEVKIGAYNGLTVEKTVHTVSDEAVEAELKRVQERNARELTREGAAENGDIVDIDFEGFVDGVAFEGGKAEHYSLTLGSGSFIPGFEDQIVGHAAGEEFDVNVTFPEQYQAAELAGKPAVFKIKLHEVKYKELPALDDELAKDCSEYDTLDEFKASIRKTIRSSWTSRTIWLLRTLWWIRSSRAWRVRSPRQCMMPAWTRWSMTSHSAWSSRACASRTT